MPTSPSPLPASNTRPRLTVAVTGLNATDSPGPGVAVIRALRETTDFDLRIIGLSYEALEPGIYLRELVDKTYQLPYPAAGTAALLARLAHIREREDVAVLIPNFDAELFNFIKLEPELRALGIHTFLPTLAQLDARDKLNLAAFGAAYGFSTPASRPLHSAFEITTAAETLGWPLVLKGRYYDAAVVHSLAQAEQAFARLSGLWGVPLIAQQFVAGQEINIAGLGDGHGRALSAVPMRKLTITDRGKAWAGITLEDEALLALARRFAEATRWRGGFELELIRTAADELVILEINPRFPAWIYLTAAAGQNQPAALLRLALGLPVTMMEGYAVGKMFVRYAWDLITDHTEFQQVAALGEL
ncbi:ATP-grasp domain-containing protein [Hymenobacter artigasi]|uniref:Carbamoyl-phosphate synthase large subunit n=1 Tax=Hymenobacter artigasi TaxID=2719616 RepID=A0ABX1HEC0_9BACT|nr:ATP-grasp domain-containing protein [Hymenobacter artigasi]NKI88350.1 carbamoyl-phosphate synthase large subunit [Hymenobacter artigasi]